MLLYTFSFCIFGGNKHEMPILGSRIIMALKSVLRVMLGILAWSCFWEHHLSFAIFNIKKAKDNMSSNDMYMLFCYFYSISLYISNRINYIFLKYNLSLGIIYTFLYRNCELKLTWSHLCKSSCKNDLFI